MSDKINVITIQEEMIEIPKRELIHYKRLAKKAAWADIYFNIIKDGVKDSLDEDSFTKCGHAQAFGLAVAFGNRLPDNSE